MHAEFADSTRDLFNTYGPDEQTAIARAVDLLEDDGERAARREDLNLVEDGYQVWGFREGRAWIAFTEHQQRLFVVHVSIISQFRS